MVTDLSHQSRRALPRDWVASKVAVHEDCDLVNMSVFEISALLWAFPPHTALHVSTGQSRIHEAHSFSGPNVSLFQQDPISDSVFVRIHPCFSRQGSLNDPVSVYL